MNKFTHFLKDESGATAIEYALLAGLIGVAIMATVTTLGTNIDKVLGMVSTKLGAIGGS
ncbi:Flp family type IVb pilin [uncultured Cohaesibacter sp.]|uniref:Flp family type IVb pilin n=1 Tax=uncultured Cohaesibacter sp. TaxID=1002546 RepID=UPI002AA88720|nr:Flp family type IVb pilin [uncultured Cohaesibacter sp.]